MKQAIKTYNLKLWLPIIVSLLFTTLLVFNFVSNYQHHHSDVETTGLTRSHDLVFELSHSINHALANNELTNVSSYISSAPVIDNLDYAVIIDDKGNINYSSKLAWQWLHIKDVFNGEILAYFQAISTVKQHRTFLHNNVLYTAADLVAPDQNASLIVSYDMQPELDEVLHHTIIDMLPMVVFILISAVLLLIFVLRHVTYPLQALQQLALNIRLHKGEITNPVSGNNAFVDVGETLVETGRQLIKDITLLADKENRLNITLDAIADGVIVTDNRGIIQRINPKAAQMIGCSNTTDKEKRIEEVFKVRSVEGEILNPALDVIKTGENIELHNHTMLTSLSGQVFHIYQSAAAIYENNKLIGVIVVFQDVSKEYQLRNQLRKNINFLENILQASPCVTFILELSKKNEIKFSYISQSIERYTGVSASQWIADTRSWSSRIPEKDLIRLKFAVEKCRFESDQVVTEVIRYQTNPDSSLFFQCHLVASEHDQEVIGVALDITEQKESQQKIHFLAYHDVLTNLPNRVLLDDQLIQTISHSQRQQENFAVLFLDLDRFKVINDTLGHAVGDKLLIQVAQRILAQMRSEDIVARAGGDEFSIILPDTDSNGAAHVAQKILNAVAEPYEIEHHTLYITTSIGICMFPENGDSVTLLKQKADNAMYRAKETERNMYQFFTEEMHEEMLQRMHLESQLHTAIEHGELSLVYQPQLDIKHNKVIGAEALLRWNHRQLGFISPAVFIPIAEESGQIEKIGQWVLREACQQLAHWQTQFNQPFTLAINLSAVQFRNTHLHENVLGLIDEFDLENQSIELEITESTAVEDVNHTIKQMERLTDTGIRFSLDDFGTGFSSLSSLKKFPISKLKVDKSFIDEMLSNKDNDAIVEAILSLAEILDVSTIAEGVETQEQLESLKQKGCDAIQGYLFSRPLPADKLLALMLKEQAKH